MMSLISKNFRVALSFFLLSCSILHSAPPTPSIPSPTSSLQKEQSPPPNPADLSQSWWRYYNVSGEELQLRIQKSIEELHRLQNSLSPEESLEASPFIERIISVLQTLPELQHPVELSTSENKPFLNEYDLEEFVGLARELQETEQELRNTILQKNLNIEILQSGNKYLDTLVAAYLIEPKPSAKKLIHGLEIMSEKLTLIVDEFQVSYLQTLENRQKEEVVHLQKEINFARNHLTFPSYLVEQVQKELQQAQKNLKNATMVAFNAQLAYTKIHTQPLSSATEKAHSSQKLIEASVQEALSQILLLNKEIENTILEINHLESQKSISLYREQITASELKVQKIGRSIADWQKNATLDMEQSLQRLSYPSEQDSSHQAGEREGYHTSLDLSQKTLLLIQKLENEMFISKFLIEQLDLLIKQKYPTFTDKIADQTTSFLIYIEEHAQWMRESFFKIGTTPITVRAILKVIIILFLGYALATFTQKFLHRLGRKHNLITESALYTFSRLAYFFILLLGLVIAISSIGIDFTAFAFVAGAFTFWIGFGLLSIIQNFVSGIIVLLDKNIRVGDYIVLESGEKGIILDVNVRTTILETLEGHKIFIPNSELIIKKFTNKKVSDQSHRISIPFKISYQADRELVCKMVIETAVGIPYTLPVPPPQVWMTELNDSNIDLALVMWVDESSINKKTTSLESIYLWAIDDTFRKNKISL